MFNVVTSAKRKGEKEGGSVPFGKKKVLKELLRVLLLVRQKEQCLKGQNVSGIHSNALLLLGRNSA
jgi:hypothetical protein